MLREYNLDNNQMEVTDPARALLFGQSTFTNFRDNLVREQCDFLNLESTKARLLEIYKKRPNSFDILSQLIKSVTPINVQAWTENFPECPEKTALMKPIETKGADRIGTVSIGHNKDSTYQYNYRYEKLRRSGNFH